MQWSDAVAPPPHKVLRQFSALWLLFFLGTAAWRAWNGQVSVGTAILAALGAGIGGLGLWRPSMIRPVYTGWMVAVFPIAWSVSRLIVMVLFYVVFTPVAVIFRLLGRDALHIRRAQVQSYFTSKPGARDAAEYLQQS